MAEKDTWDKFESLSRVLAALLIPIVLGLIGSWYTSAQKQRELDARFAEVALNILARPPNPSDTTDRYVRQWAAKLVSRYSGLPLGDSAVKSVVEKAPLASGPPVISLEDTYQVSDDPVTLHIRIGNAQLGQSRVTLDGQLVASGALDSIPLGDGPAVAGKLLHVVTVVVAVNPATQSSPLTYTLTGGPSERALTVTGQASSDGRVVRFEVRILLVPSKQ
jgi:hypothetical protein